MKPWCIWRFFERAVKESKLPGANKVALADDQGTQVTFEELQAMAETIDVWMRERGAGPGTKVMLVNSISVWALAAVLAVLRNGSVIVPNDHKDPAEYRAELIRMADVTLVLCENPVDGLPAGVDCICKATSVPPAQNAKLGEPRSFEPEELAAIFFSSGSTGKPKGVMHSALIWYEFTGLRGEAKESWYLDAWADADDAYSRELHPITWCDGTWHGSITWYSNWAVLSDVMNGKQVTIITESTLLDAPKLQQLRQRHGLRTMYFSPSLLKTIVKTDPGVLSDLELIYVWGEKLEPALVDLVGKEYPEVKLCDWLGTSETFLGIARVFKASEGIQSARWLADFNTEVHIVEKEDHTKEIRDFDKPGIMCFSRPAGVTFCIGYLGNEQLSNEKFVKNPFGDGKMFIVGDVAAWRKGPETAVSKAHREKRGLSLEEGYPGVLEVIGRDDDQIKVRGQMVNLVMVDEVARKCPGVRDAGSRSYKDRDGENAVSLYLVGDAADGTTTVDIDEARNFLAQSLPPYAVPATIALIDSVPRNKNGKLVRKQLPMVDTGPVFKPDPEPESVPDKVLWVVRNAFESNAIVEADDFFKLGGHSLLAVQITAGLRKSLKVQIKVPTLYKNSTVEELQKLVAERLQDGGAEEPPPLGRRVAHDESDQSALSVIPVPAVTFNVSCMVRGPEAIQRYQTVSMAVWLEGRLDTDALKSALKLVHDRHEALRMYYTIDQETGDRCMAVVSKEIFVLPLKEVNLISLGEEAAEKEAQRLYSHDACHEQFDPFNQYPQSGFGPLSHFYLIQVTEDKALFFYGMHHAILDGFSDTVMWTEINTAYANIVRGASPSLPALDAQYPDFALWQAEKLYQTSAATQGFSKMARLYMADGVGCAPPPDFAGVPCESVVRHAAWYRGGPWTETSFPFSVCENLKKAALSNGCTLFQAVIAVFHIWQHQWTQKDEVGLGVTLTGRHHPALEKMIGNFQQSSCVRTNLHGCRTFVDVLTKVKSSFLEMLELADFACYDHASWADILRECPGGLASMPSEVRAYLSERPKAYLNFEEFDYGSASTAGFKAAGLKATNQVSPVDPADCRESDDIGDSNCDSATDREMTEVTHTNGTTITTETLGERTTTTVVMPGGSSLTTISDALAASTTTTVVAVDGTTSVVSTDNAATCTEATITHADGAVHSTTVIPDEHGVCEPYRYPSCVDMDFGPRTSGLREIDDYEMYFAFSMSSRTAQDIAGYDEDYCYMAYDDKLYKPETAKAALVSFVSLLKACAEDPSRTVICADNASTLPEPADDQGRSCLSPETAAFLEDAIGRWQARLKTSASRYRAAQKSSL